MWNKLSHTSLIDQPMKRRIFHSYPVNNLDIWEMNSNIEVMSPSKRILLGKKCHLEKEQFRSHELVVLKDFEHVRYIYNVLFGI